VPSFLPIISFILLALLVLSYKTGIRRAILITAVIWGVLLVGMTELLSLFHLITFSGILSSWIAVILLVIVWLIYRGCKWWSTNSKFLFEDEEHRQDVMVALGSLAHFNVQIFISSFPSFTLLFENFIDLMHGEDFDEEEE